MELAIFILSGLLYLALGVILSLLCDANGGINKREAVLFTVLWPIIAILAFLAWFFET